MHCGAGRVVDHRPVAGGRSSLMHIYHDASMTSDEQEALAVVLRRVLDLYLPLDEEAQLSEFAEEPEPAWDEREVR